MITSRTAGIVLLLTLVLKFLPIPFLNIAKYLDVVVLVVAVLLLVKSESH